MSEKEIIETLSEDVRIDEEAEGNGIADVVINEDAESQPNAIQLGKIANCQNVYVREKPDKGSKPLTIVPAGAGLLVDTNEEANGFYKVLTENEVTGYCMKEFVEFVEEE